MSVEVSGWLALLAFLVAGAMSVGSRSRPRLRRLRRPLGLLAWSMASLHGGFSLAALDGVGVAILDRWEALPHVRTGVLAWVLLAALAATSPTFVRRRLPPSSWDVLHQAVIPAAALILAHLVAAPRIDPVASLLAAAAVAALTVARIVLRRRRTGSTRAAKVAPDGVRGSPRP